jgi:hypothetical protein
MALNDARRGLRLRAWPVRNQCRTCRQVDLPWQVPTISGTIL